MIRLITPSLTSLVPYYGMDRVHLQGVWFMTASTIKPQTVLDEKRRVKYMFDNTVDNDPDQFLTLV